MWDDWALQKTYDEIKIMYEYAEAAKFWTFGYFSKKNILNFVLFFRKRCAFLPIKLQIHSRT